MREILLHHRLLRQVADLLGADTAPFNFSAHGRTQAENGLHQGAFARSVFTEDAQVIALLHLKGNILCHNAVLIAEGGIHAAKLCTHDSSASFSVS